MYVKCLEQCLAHSKPSLGVSYSYSFTKESFAHASEKKRKQRGLTESDEEIEGEFHRSDSSGCRVEI